MANEYKNIPVDMETKKMLEALCAAYGRKQGAQVKQLVKVEFEKLQQSNKKSEKMLSGLKVRLEKARKRVEEIDISA
jgi:hypothetical protein